MEASTKRILVIAGLVAILIAAVAVPLMLMNPRKTEVRYGTLTVDADGNVIADDTKTAWVPVSEADKYELEVITQGGTSAAGTQEVQTNQPITTTGPDYANIALPLTTDTKNALSTLVGEINALNQNAISALDLLNMTATLQESLAETRATIEATPVPAEMEPQKQTLLQAYDLYIEALSVYPTNMAQAYALIQQANALIQSLAQ